MEKAPTILEKAEKKASDLLLTLPDTMTYHNLNHTREVVKAAEKIGSYASLQEEEMEILLLAAWFHDV